MIGQHPDLYSFPELSLFSAWTVREALCSDPGLDPAWRAYRVSGLYRSVAELLKGEQTQDGIDAARRWVAERLDWSTIALFDCLQEAVQPRVAVEKSPETSASDSSILRLLAAYPRARFVHLVRHPVTTLRSMYSYYEQWQSSTDVPLEIMCAASWYSCHDRILRVLSELAPQRTLTVRAEDVLNDSQRELARIARWLGLREDDGVVHAMMRPEDSRFASVGPVGATGGNDPNFLTHPRPHRIDAPESFDLPDEWNVGAKTRSLVAELAEVLGYESC